MFMMAEFWVTLAFFVLVAAALYFKMPAMVTKALDARADNIRKELDDARRLREEAKQILADYKRKQSEAEQEAQAIVDQAKSEASNLREEARKALDANIARRTKLAEEKIARAEAQAISEVRATAVDVALGAAEAVLLSKTAGSTGKQLIDNGITELKGKFN